MGVKSGELIQMVPGQQDKLRFKGIWSIENIKALGNDCVWEVAFRKLTCTSNGVTEIGCHFFSSLSSALPALKRTWGRLCCRIVQWLAYTTERLSRSCQPPAPHHVLLIGHTSMSVRWISLSAEVPSENLLPPIASISSMKMMQGWWSRANANISRIKRADSPIYLSTIALDTTCRWEGEIAPYLDGKREPKEAASAQRGSKCIPVKWSPDKSSSTINCLDENGGQRRRL